MSSINSYTEYSPHILLSAYIDCYWSKKCTELKTSSYRILPDGCLDIIFDFTGHDEPVYLVGTATTYINKAITGKEDYFGIRFRPGGFYPFFNQPVSLFTDQKINVSDFSKQLYDRLLLAITAEAADVVRIDKANTLLMKLLSGNHDVVVQPYIASSINTILKSHGTIPVKKLVNLACIGERQFQRKFTEAVGVSPKTLCNIIRFKHTSALIKNTGTSITSLAYENGYFDHSHLFKEFKKFSGKGPL